MDGSHRLQFELGQDIRIREEFAAVGAVLGLDRLRERMDHERGLGRESGSLRVSKRIDSRQPSSINDTEGQ
jgi:hypothetical protein